MPLNHPSAGPDWTAEYQVSALPFVTSSTVSGVKNEEFGGYITSAISVKNTSSGSLYIGFTQLGVQANNKLQLAASESFSANIRIAQLWLSGSTSYELFAGITAISSRHMAKITGSNGYPGVG